MTSRFWSDVVRDLSPYVPGEQPKLTNLVKLNTNENPYPPSPRVRTAIEAELAQLRLYPDPNADRVREALARHHGLTADQVFVGNGSDEVLAHVFLALLAQDEPILFPDVTYSFYPVYCRLYGIDFEEVPLGEHFQLRVDDYRRANGGIIFPNPNAPTGVAVARADVRRLLEHNTDTVVVIDEAYVDFGAESAVSLVNEFPNLLVVQTLSKSRSLAGLRVGYAFGDADLVEALERVKNSFNSYPLDRLAIAGAVEAIADDTYFEQTRQAVMTTRDMLVTELDALGFEVLPSLANFVFVRHPHHDAADLQAGLRARHVIVRHFEQSRISQYLRITVGTDEQCALLIGALQDMLRA
ncbi:MAG: histidinol-phosphate transaminase [Gammaproteobacteria bacterium]